MPVVVLAEVGVGPDATDETVLPVDAPPAPQPPRTPRLTDATPDGDRAAWWATVGPLAVSAAALLVVGVIGGLVVSSWLDQAGDSTTANETLGHGLADVAAAPTANAAAAVVELADTDTDGDGLVSADDNCPDVANADQANTDGDDDGDACDLDDDEDAVEDAVDNCPLIVNADQADDDADGIGDACDDFPDKDADGIIDTEDPCIEDPDDVDTDGDGVVDKCDATPRGLVPIAASASVARVTVLNTLDDDELPDLFGDLDVGDEDVDLPEIRNRRDISPTDWGSGLVAVDPTDGDIPVRVWIRDESGFCLFCKDILVDLTPVPGADALHLLVNGVTGEVRLADEDWEPQATIATLTGPVDGDLSGSVTVEGDDDEIHRASITVALTVVRQPAPEPDPEPVDP
ncbi:MAG: thrombospondin type 3 repeat-containing protein [Actinomycetota bacterium]